MTDSATTGTNGAAPQKMNPLDLFKSAKAPSVPAAKPAAVAAAEALPQVSEEKPALIAFDGEQEIRIPENAKFKREIDGEGEVEFTAKDLFNSFKTSRQIDREFSRLDKERKLTAKERDELKRARDEQARIDGHIKLMAEALQNGKPLEAVEIATQLAGGAKGNEGTVEALVKQAREIADKFENMSEEEEAAFWENRKRERDAAALEKKKQEVEWKEYKLELKAFVDHVKATANLTDQDLAAAYQELQQWDRLLHDAGKPLMVTGKDGHTITKECAKWALGSRFKARVTNVINKVSSKHANDRQFLSDVISLVDDRWSDSDIEDIVRGALGEDSTSQPSKDSQTEVSKPAATKAVAQLNAKPEGASREASTVEKGAGPILSWKDMIRKHS